MDGKRLTTDLSGGLVAMARVKPTVSTSKVTIKQFETSPSVLFDAAIGLVTFYSNLRG